MSHRRTLTNKEKQERCKTNFGFWLLSQPKGYINIFMEVAKVYSKTLWKAIEGKKIYLSSAKRIMETANNTRLEQQLQPFTFSDLQPQTK